MQALVRNFYWRWQVALVYKLNFLQSFTAISTPSMSTFAPMGRTQEILQDVVIKFAGDSGDGMQLTGTQFTNNTALLGTDLSTFPDFPAEIRAPQGTLPGVSGYQLRFSSDSIYTPGDTLDVLVAMNAAALKTNLKHLKKGGKVIVNTDGFDVKNLRLANYPD